MINQLRFQLPRFVRLLGKPKGLERVVRYFLPMTKFAGTEEFQLALREGNITVRPASHVGWHIYCFGNYEPGLRRLMRHHVKPGAVCLEIGANIGWHTLLFSRLAGDAGIVHAFEPNPSVLADLKRNLQMNDCKNVTLWPMALAEHRGTARFAAPGAGSRAAGDGHLKQAVEHAGQQEEEIEVEVETVDGLFGGLSRLEFIKIDVEGWEPAVWQGARHTLSKFMPVICMEQLPEHLNRAGFATKDATAPLLELGYRLFAYGDRGEPRRLESPETYSGDIYALPPERSGV